MNNFPNKTCYLFISLEQIELIYKKELFQENQK